MTTSINQHVWHLIQGDLAIQKDISRKIVNMRALAKFLITQYTLSYSLDSVISAIRRFQSSEVFEEEEDALLHIFKDARISTRNNFACITLGITASEFHKRFCRTNDHHNHHGMKLVTSSKAVKLMVDMSELKKIQEIFSPEEVLAVDADLSEISVLVSDKAMHTKGVIARLAEEVTLSHINIHELIVAMPEFLVYVKHKDLVRAHDSLLKLSKQLS